MSGTQAALPNPPPYYTAFGAGGEEPEPPPVPTGPVTVFGFPVDLTDQLIRPLDEQEGVERLYSTDPDFDHVKELKALVRRLLAHFLELVDTLTTESNATDYLQARDDKLKELQQLFFNIHHLLNEFRPHQGRETVRGMLAAQHKEREAFVVDIQNKMDVANARLADCKRLLTDAATRHTEQRAATDTASTMLVDGAATAAARGSAWHTTDAEADDLLLDALS